MLEFPRKALERAQNSADSFQTEEVALLVVELDARGATSVGLTLIFLPQSHLQIRW